MGALECTRNPKEVSMLYRRESRQFLPNVELVRDSHVCITCLCDINNHLREIEQTAFESLKEKWGCVVAADGRVPVSSPASS